ncbi:PIN domain-containing protein [Marispirochaeta sp.]|jgi:uncharacterized protein|uniref:type II toxin-antitoxin system VapC family toxin n=1 Tax=Marispirochaeta sp. TaxID=2038653 RepID=UPI0029C81070|nr:PIN domain-containing protein [Marispirochaeta sp.]
MKSILIDAGPIIALFNKNDRYHEKILNYIKNYNGKLYSSWAVLTEVSHMLGFSISAQLDFLKWIRTGAIEVINLDYVDIDRIIELSEKYSDVPMDLADATLVVIAEKYEIKEILTIDNDYYIYRTIEKEMLENVLDRNL